MTISLAGFAALEKLSGILDLFINCIYEPQQMKII